MKKTYYLLIAVLLILQSCSTGGSSNNNTTSIGSILVTKMIETKPDGVYTSIYSYNGNKIAQVTVTLNNSSGITRAYYTYTGNLISSCEIYNSSNTMTEKWMYNYNSNSELASFIDLDFTSSTGARIVYTHNPDGSISSIEYHGDLTNQNTVALTSTLTFSNGELHTQTINNGTSTKALTYTYDNKNSPYKNIVGNSLVSFAVSGYESILSEVNHNLIQDIQSDNGSQSFLTDYQYTYDTNGFPVTKSITTNGVTYVTGQYFY